MTPSVRASSHRSCQDPLPLAASPSSPEAGILGGGALPDGGMITIRRGAAGSGRRAQRCVRPTPPTPVRRGRGTVTADRRNSCGRLQADAVCRGPSSTPESGVGRDRHQCGDQTSVAFEVEHAVGDDLPHPRPAGPIARRRWSSTDSRVSPGSARMSSSVLAQSAMMLALDPPQA